MRNVSSSQGQSLFRSKLHQLLHAPSHLTPLPRASSVTVKAFLCFETDELVCVKMENGVLRAKEFCCDETHHINFLLSLQEYFFVCGKPKQCVVA